MFRCLCVNVCRVRFGLLFHARLKYAVRGAGSTSLWLLGDASSTHDSVTGHTMCPGSWRELASGDSPSCCRGLHHPSCVSQGLKVAPLAALGHLPCSLSCFRILISLKVPINGSASTWLSSLFCYLPSPTIDAPCA